MMRSFVGSVGRPSCVRVEFGLIQFALDSKFFFHFYCVEHMKSTRLACLRLDSRL